MYLKCRVMSVDKGVCYKCIHLCNLYLSQDLECFQPSRKFPWGFFGGDHSLLSPLQETTVLISISTPFKVLELHINGITPCVFLPTIFLVSTLFLSSIHVVSWIGKFVLHCCEEQLNCLHKQPVWIYHFKQISKYTVYSFVLLMDVSLSSMTKLLHIFSNFTNNFWCLPHVLGLS